MRVSSACRNLLSVEPMSEELELLFEAPSAVSRFWKLLSSLDMLESEEDADVEELLSVDEELLEEDDSFWIRLSRSDSMRPGPPGGGGGGMSPCTWPTVVVSLPVEPFDVPEELCACSVEIRFCMKERKASATFVALVSVLLESLVVLELSDDESLVVMPMSDKACMMALSSLPPGGGPGGGPPCTPPASQLPPPWAPPIRLNCTDDMDDPRLLIFIDRSFADVMRDIGAAVAGNVIVAAELGGDGDKEM